MITLRFYKNFDYTSSHYAVVIKTVRDGAPYGCSYTLAHQPQSTEAGYALKGHGKPVKPRSAKEPLALEDIPEQVLRQAWRLAGQAVGAT